MEATSKSELTSDERQANIDQLVSSWKARKKQMEQDNQDLLHTPEYQAALGELEKRRIARGTRTVKV